MSVVVALTVAFWPRESVVPPHPYASHTSVVYSYVGGRHKTEIPNPFGPRWTKGSNNPPMGASEAVRLATKIRRAKFPDRPNWPWVIEQTSLVPWNVESGYWYWQIQFGQEYQPPPNMVMGAGHSGPATELNLIVLMDGTVLTPTPINRE